MSAWEQLRRGRCQHFSHGWWELRCWRLVTYDGQCSKHNRTCFHACGRPSEESEKR